jgi:signal transduction histidine kinase
MTLSLNSAIVRIRDGEGYVVGAGFLVGDDQVLTCAHVLDDALGRPRGSSERPVDHFQLDFPLVASDRQLDARVACWKPTQDVAGLELIQAPPAGARSVRLVQANDPWGNAFRAFGFPRGYENGVWASGRILEREATGWLQIEVVNQTGYFVAPGFSGGPVWAQTPDGVVGITVAADTTPGCRAAFIIPTKQLVAAWPELETWTIPVCPYRGLLAFREQDALFFFGREVLTERLLEAVQGPSPAVAVVGPSGSGKSSVVSAGLLPRLRQAPSANEWIIVRLRPGEKPFEELANALLPPLEPEMTRTDRLIEVPKLRNALREGRVTLSRVAATILEQSPGAGRLLLVIDQFEELYTLCSDMDTRHAFLDCLIQVVSQSQSSRSTNLHIVLTLRADFMGQALSYRPFADLLDRAEKLIVGPMNREELEATIISPAEQQGVAFDDGLPSRILGDVSNQAGNLPLLEFALTQLWERQEGSRLTHAAYEAIGGVKGALTRYADQIYDQLSQTEQEQARWVFTQLVCPGKGTEDTRRRATRTELAGADWNLIRKLSDARLVVTDRDPTGQEIVEVAHEALIQDWERLRAWMAKDREFRLWQERLRTALHQWEETVRDEGALLHGVPLAEAMEWLSARGDDLNEAERDFIQAGQEQQLREERRLEELQAEVAATRQLSTLNVAIAALQHRINNTFNIIVPNMTRLRKHVDTSDPTIQEILDIVERNARYTSDIMQRIQEPLREVEFQDVDINDVLTYVARRIEDERNYSVDIDLALDDSIPLISAPVGQITEIFWNLAENACRVMNEEGQLTITSSQVDGNIEIRVEDTGPGIPPRIQKRLFIRPIPSKEPGGGAGLGLWLSSLMLQTFGGSIKIERTGPSGTTVLVQIPLPEDL